MMSITKTNDIRHAIKLAKANESEAAQLRPLIEAQMSRLHGAIQLPQQRPVDALVDFVMRYVDHVPNCIDALTGLTKAAGIYDYTSIFLTIAEEFFLEPPEVVADRCGMVALMDEAYLAHRLIEEVNDRIIGHCGIPLAPMDMTQANLVVHELIGEPFANELDFVVHYSTELHMEKENLMDNPAFHRFVEERKENGWSTEISRWPCLAEDLAISLTFFDDTKPYEEQVASAAQIIH